MSRELNNIARLLASIQKETCCKATYEYTYIHDRIVDSNPTVILVGSSLLAVLT